MVPPETFFLILFFAYLVYSRSPGGSPIVSSEMEDPFVASKFVMEGQFACLTPGKAEVPLCPEISGSFPKSLFFYFMAQQSPLPWGTNPLLERLPSQVLQILGCEHFA